MKHVNLRLPDALHAAAKDAADADHRSLNSLLIVVIEKALGAEERQERGTA